MSTIFLRLISDGAEFFRIIFILSKFSEYQWEYKGFFFFLPCDDLLKRKKKSKENERWKYLQAFSVRHSPKFCLCDTASLDI